MLVSWSLKVRNLQIIISKWRGGIVSRVCHVCVTCRDWVLVNLSFGDHRFIVPHVFAIFRTRAFLFFWQDFSMSVFLLMRLQFYMCCLSYVKVNLSDINHLPLLCKSVTTITVGTIKFKVVNTRKKIQSYKRKK